MPWPGLTRLLLCYILLSEISFYQLFTIPVHFSKSRKFLTDLLLKNPESFPVHVKSFKYLRYFRKHVSNQWSCLEIMETIRHKSGKASYVVDVID